MAMTNFGKLNLLGMLLLPAAATLAALIVFGVRTDTLVTVFGLNLVPMLIAGLVSALLLRGANRVGKGQRIALWPTAIPAVLGAVWYLFRAVFPAEVAPGAEYIAGPQYLLMGVIALSVVAWIGCLIARRF
ncbi:MAG: hypothetical protein OEV14_07500 [Gammaproteobacteria bacterium]|nr:hypothetical protein [Gammaproteobacteria bacterium]